MGYYHDITSSIHTWSNVTMSHNSLEFSKSLSPLPFCSYCSTHQQQKHGWLGRKQPTIVGTLASLKQGRVLDVDLHSYLHREDYLVAFGGSFTWWLPRYSMFSLGTFSGINLTIFFRCQLKTALGYSSVVSSGLNFGTEVLRPSSWAEQI